MFWPHLDAVLWFVSTLMLLPGVISFPIYLRSSTSSSSSPSVVIPFLVCFLAVSLQIHLGFFRVLFFHFFVPVGLVLQGVAVMSSQYLQTR